jgi:hypothetical protein
MTTTRTKTGTFHNRLLTIILVNPGLQPGGLADRLGVQDLKLIGSLSKALEAAHAGNFIVRRQQGPPAALGWHLTERGIERLNLYGSN